MKLTWHITKKDLRRLTVPLAGFALLLIAKIGLGLVLRNAQTFDDGWFSRLGLYLNLFAILEALFIYLLVGLLIHEDPLVGTQAGWRTRPITGGMLLRSKLLTCAWAFWLLPVLVALPWWLVCGFDPAQMGRAALEVIFLQTIVFVPAIALAILSENFSRYICLGIVAVVLGMFVFVMGMAYLPKQENLTWNLMQSRTVIIMALATIGLVTVIVRQFYARTLGVAYAIWLTIVIAIPCVALAWPLDIIAAWRAGVADSSEQTRAIKVRATWARINYLDATDVEGPARSVIVNLRVEGAPDDLALATRLSELSWRTRSGELHADAAGTDLADYYPNNRDRVVSRQLGLRPWVVDPETAQWQEMQRQKRIKEGISHEISKLPPPMPEEELRKQLQFKVNLRGVAQFEPPVQKSAPTLALDFVLARPQLFSELPLKANEWHTTQGFGIRIAEVIKRHRTYKFYEHELEADQRGVTFVETQSDSPWMAQNGFSFHTGAPMVLAPESVVLTRDLGQTGGGTTLNMGSQSVRVDGVQVTWHTFTIEEPRVIRNGNWTSLRADWADHVTLAFFRYEIEGAFRRTLQLESIKNARPHP